MSSFVGFIRWGDDRVLDARGSERLAAAVAASGQSRPAVLSAPPFHAAFRQVVVTPEDRWERQPSVLGDVVSLFAGRIDDRETLAARLDHALHEVPDGRLAQAAYRRWGDQAAHDIVGEFAWAIWDGGARRLTLSRDASSAHTLYVYQDRRVVAFATGLRALLALPEVPRDVDDEALADFVAINPAWGPKTLYRGIERIMPGTTASIERERPTRITASQPRHVQVPRKPEDCAAAAREVFGRAMEARLRALGPVAVSLSGGLDSSIVAAEAAVRCAPDRVRGFVLVPKPGAPIDKRDWEAPDDRDQIAALARRYPNLDVTFVEPGVDPLDVDPTALFLATGHPVMMAPNFTWLIAAWRAARTSGARLLLTGDDGEMSLTHYGYLRAVVRQGDIGHAVREAWRGSGRGQGRFLGHLDRAFLDSRLTRLRDRDSRGRPGNWSLYAALDPDFAAATGVRERLLAEGFPRGHVHLGLSQRELVTRSRRWQAQPSENIAALRHLSGLAYTSPFSDRRVIDFCLSLPESMFIRDGWTRWLARAAFRDILPTEVGERTVKAVQNGEWFHRIDGHREAYRAQLERIQTSPLAARVLDLPRLKALLDAWPNSTTDAAAAGPAYRSTLVRGLHAGAFLRWLDSGNG